MLKFMNSMSISKFLVRLKSILQAQKAFFLISVAFLAIKLLILLWLSNSFDFKTFDSDSYLNLGQNFQQAYFFRQSVWTDESIFRTPGYPAFLYLLGNSDLIILFAQIFLHSCLAVVSLILLRELVPTATFRTQVIFFIIVNADVSTLVYSYYFLTESIFTFVLTSIFLILLKKNSFQKKYIWIASFLIIILLSVRPIGVVLIFFLASGVLFFEKRKTALVLLLISIAFVFSWSSWNKIRGDVFTFSTVQNFNLHMFEGAGALAINKGVPLEVAQKTEREVRDGVLGSNPNIKSMNDYSLERGLTLIRDYFKEFAILHVKGTAAILVGPNEGETIRLLSRGERTSAVSFTEKVIVGFNLLLAIVIALSAFSAVILNFRTNFNIIFIANFIFIYLVFSSGAQAYGRFRTPIQPLLLLLTFYFLVHNSRKVWDVFALFSTLKNHIFARLRL
jgi:hypothetical protein